MSEIVDDTFDESLGAYICECGEKFHNRPSFDRHVREEHKEMGRGAWPPPTELPSTSLPQPDLEPLLRKSLEMIQKSDVFEELKKDLDARNELGFKLHGKRLLVNNDGRDWLKEAYEEMLDLCVYFKAQLIKRENDRR